MADRFKDLVEDDVERQMKAEKADKLNGFMRAAAFVEESVQLGYKLDGSVFKIDRSGSGWNVSFWFRRTYDKSFKTILGGRIAKAKNVDFNTAVDTAIKKALEFEERYKNR